MTTVQLMVMTAQQMKTVQLMTVLVATVTRELKAVITKLRRSQRKLQQRKL